MIKSLGGTVPVPDRQAGGTVHDPTSEGGTVRQPTLKKHFHNWASLNIKSKRYLTLKRNFC